MDGEGLGMFEGFQAQGFVDSVSSLAVSSCRCYWVSTRETVSVF